MGMRVLIFVMLVVLWPGLAGAQERVARLHAPPALVETGLIRHILPRFTLKTQIRVELAATPEAAELVLGAVGTPLFEGEGQVWHLEVLENSGENAGRLADWLGSEVGARTVTGFAPDGVALFTLPAPTTAVAVVAEVDGDAGLGWRVSREKCARCHAVDAETRMAGIGSTPSFAVLRGLTDWQERFAGFFALNPHPSFTMIADVTPPFPSNRPPPIAPVEMSLEEVEAVLAYVAAIQAADLGAPLRHQ